MPIRPLALLFTAALVLPACGTARAEGSEGPLPPVERATPLATMASRDSAFFAGGCFWGVEAVFERVKGVIDVTSGYAGGRMANPSYEMVSSGTTGHAESVRIIFDPSVVSYTDLLRIFFSVAHDPTQLNRQGPDVGTQYRSAIFTVSAAQKVAADGYIAQLTKAGTFKRPIVTQVTPLARFNVAEEYHQGYYDAHPDQPYIVYNDRPKVEALKREFGSLYVER